MTTQESVTTPLTNRINDTDRLSSLYLGLGNMIYALSKVDGRVQEQEETLVRQLLAQEIHGDVALHAFLVLEDCDVPVEKAYDFAMRRFVDNRAVLSKSLSNQFISILQRVAEAHDNVSRKEQEFIKRLRRDIQRLV
ncbi:MAG: TerB family tellurite resistance protein [Spirosoma sp.]|nr:TerB family tellurite resistance protein [Spirosoma sp.]